MSKSKTSQRNITIEDRRTEVLNLRRQGSTIREIAATLNVAVGTIHKDISVALDNLRATELLNTEQWVQLELARLDAATLAIFPQVEAGNLKAINTLLNVMCRRAKLLGLDSQPPNMDVLSALKILMDNEMIPAQTVQIASTELNRATLAIAHSLSGHSRN